jgi:4,5-dihydroxyphthalate decarboxylase
MGGKLRLTVACGDYEIVRSLKEGSVKADGLDLIFLTGMGSREFISRMARRLEFDVAEMGVTTYVTLRSQGAPLTAIPVFLHRRFRHGFIFVNTAAHVETPKDLIAKRVGGNIEPAANTWIRGILEEHYGVQHDEVRWVVEPREADEFPHRSGLRTEFAPTTLSLEDMLLEGKLAAMISPAWPKALLNGDRRIGYLFPNYKDVELEYFQRTKIFPIMHLVAIKQEIVNKYPWVTTNLVTAFEVSKQLAYRRLLNPRIVPLAWYTWAQQEQNRVLGQDPWAYGLNTANRNNLDTLLRYMVKQGLTETLIPVDDLFANSDPPEMFRRTDDELRL